jgi:hypothetical protein
MFFLLCYAAINLRCLIIIPHFIWIAHDVFISNLLFWSLAKQKFLNLVCLDFERVKPSNQCQIYSPARFTLLTRPTKKLVVR